MPRNTLRIGTRSSELALWQTNHVRERLRALHPGLTVDVVSVKTLGDKILDSPLAKIGDKGLFTKELETALLDGRVDLAVHSLKDVPTLIPAGLVLGAILEREDVRDAFIAHPSKHGSHFSDLPANATVATGSLRRKCQLLAARPDLHIVDIRGNLNTRMKKLEESDWNGMILAIAGVTRLGWTSSVSEILPFDLMLPAVGQGALAIEIRDDSDVAQIIAPLIHRPTELAVRAERALLKELEGGCQIPIGAHASVNGSIIVLDAVVGSLDGTRVVRGSHSGDASDPESIGRKLAGDLLVRGGKEILEEIRRTA